MGEDQMSLWYRRIKNLYQIINFAISYDGGVDNKELEKTEHYQDLAWELRKIWNMKVKVIPLIIGALGKTPIKLRNWLTEIGTKTQITELQKAVLLHTAWNLQKLLEV